MKDEYKLAIAIMTKNIIIVALFVTLAIVFNKWWISLFSILFWNGVKLKEDDK